MFGNLCLHSKRICIRPSSCVAPSLDSHTWQRSGVGRGGASFWLVVFEWYKCRPLVRDHRVRRNGRAGIVLFGGDQQRHSMGQISRLLGRPKCLSGREDESRLIGPQVWCNSCDYGLIARKRVERAPQHTTEVTLDQSDEASAHDFCATDGDPSHSSV